MKNTISQEVEDQFRIIKDLNEQIAILQARRNNAEFRAISIGKFEDYRDFVYAYNNWY